MNKTELREQDVLHRDGKLEMKIYHTLAADCHWHDEMEFIYVTDGFCRLTVNGSTFLVQKGQAALILSGELHDMSAMNTGDYYAIVLHPHICGSECMHFFSGTYPIQRIFTNDTPAEAMILRALSDIRNTYENRPFAYELRLRSLICEIFATIFENKLFAMQSSDRSASTQIFEEMISYIHTHYPEKLTLDMLSKQYNYSKSYIIRLFRKHTGNTPLDYLNRHRISIAQLMLLDSDKNLLENSAECGIENIGHFIRLFHRYTGQTPGKWRKASAKTE